jgi:DNA-binding response OmpR family regulator
VRDLMLRKLDGFDVCRILRQEMSTPILMLTAREDSLFQRHRAQACPIPCEKGGVWI